MSIDSLYEDVIAKLTKQGEIKAISQKLLSLTKNEDRVLYVYDILVKLDIFPPVQHIVKTENVSTYYRNQGNRYFKNKEDYKAWQYYNLSLLHAPFTSDNYCLSLANRSAVFYSMKKFKQCFQDVKEVLSLNYPQKLKEKLNKRLVSCEEEILKEECLDDDTSEVDRILTMHGPVDTRYPCASSKLEVVFSEQMGRHVIAKEDIGVGEVLVQENPYFTLLLKSQLLFSCSYCLSRELHLLPCPHCCFTLYCSEECRNNSWKDYHSIECPLIPTLIQMEFTKLELLALRTVIKARNDHTSWEGLFNTIEDAEANSHTEYRGHVKVDNKWIYDSKYYASIHTLATNIEKRSISDIFQKCVTAAVFLHLLSVETHFLKDTKLDNEERIRKCVAGCLLLHIMTSPTNMHGLSTNIQTAEGNFVEEISLGSAPYAFHSLLNHSCAPNVVRFGKLGTGQMTLYAIRPIKKGMQLFDNYGAHHAIQDRITRQGILKFQYKFTCLCEACVNDWPLYFLMNTAQDIPVKILNLQNKLLNSGAIENLQRGDRSRAIKLFKPLCELIELLEAYAPCKELSDCQESLKQCLVILRGLLPYGYKQQVEWNLTPITN